MRKCPVLIIFHGKLAGASCFCYGQTPVLSPTVFHLKGHRLVPLYCDRLRTVWFGAFFRDGFVRIQTSSMQGGCCLTSDPDVPCRGVDRLKTGTCKKFSVGHAVCSRPVQEEPPAAPNILRAAESFAARGRKCKDIPESVNKFCQMSLQR